MAIATAWLIEMLLRILTQSRCPNAGCVLVWRSTPSLYHENTPAPVVVAIPQRWPNGGGQIVDIKPRVDACIDVILDCGCV